MMSARLQKLWLIWSAILGTTLFALAIGFGDLSARAERELEAPEQGMASQAIGRLLASKINRAISRQIAIEDLEGIEDWFVDTAAANEMIVALLLTDSAGKALAAYKTTTEMRAAVSNRTEPVVVDGMYVASVPLYDRDGLTVGWLHVGSAPPPLGNWPLLWSLLWAAGATMVGSLLLRAYIDKRLGKPLAAVDAACVLLSSGQIPVMRRCVARDEATALLSCLADRTIELRKRHGELLLKIEEVRAAHFDPNILHLLDALFDPLLARQFVPDHCAESPQDAQKILPSAARRVTRACKVSGVFLVCFLAMLHQLLQEANDEKLSAVAEQAVRQGWRATIDQDRESLSRELNSLLIRPSDVGLLKGVGASGIDGALKGLVSSSRALAVFDLTGAVLAASGRKEEAAPLDPALLEPLREGLVELHGVWQNQSRRYQLGVARRLVLPPSPNGKGNVPQEVILTIATPLESSLEHLAQRLSAQVSATDLRGQSLSGGKDPLTESWHRHGRKNHLAHDRDVPVFLIALPLVAPSGHMIGSLLAELPAPAADSVNSLMTVVILLLSLSVVIFLVLYVRRLVIPIAKGAQRFEALSNGDTDTELAEEVKTAEVRFLQSVAQRIGQKIYALGALRRSRERQGRRQARFIRRQMMTLAEKLDESARHDVLEDLNRIELAKCLPSPSGESRVAGAADEFGILALGFQNLVSRISYQYEELGRLVAELSEALRTKTQFIALQQELEIARHMQLSILPQDYRTRGGLELHAKMVPAREVGGDFYDFFNLDEYRVGLVIADVSGKGVAAAFFMAISRTLLSAIAQFGDSPADCIGRLNDLLAADNDETMFVTLFYGSFDTRNGILTYCNAGHNPPYILRADGQIEIVPGTNGVALAVVENVTFEQATAHLNPGDGLFMYTDGITEASDSGYRMFGNARLVAALKEFRTMPVREIPDMMVARVKEFTEESAQTDDITCLMARFKGAE